MYHCDGSLPSGSFWVSAKEVTGLVQQTNNQLIVPCQNCMMGADTSRHYVQTAFLLTVIYEDPTLAPTNTAIYVNNMTYSQTMTQVLSGLNPLDTLFDIGLSIWVSDAYTLVAAGQKVFYSLQSGLGSFNLGILDGWDGNTTKKSLPGSFYYDNGTLTGLVDDTPDNIIDSTDALANIRAYLPNLSSTFTLTSIGNVADGCIDDRLTYTIAARTPCDATTVTSTQTYSVCSGQGTSLSAFGIGTYKWWPTTGLSSSTAPNPLASPTVTTNYILTVTDSNGCHHTEHHTVGVYSVPKISSVSITPAVCGDQGGTAIIASPTNGAGPYTYNIGAGYQNSNLFDSLGPAIYSYTVTDSKGCVFVSPNTFTVDQVNNADASFNISPDTICYPSDPVISSTSATVNNYSWYLNNSLISNSQTPSYHFLDTGLYSLTLIAFHNLPQCSDTVIKTVFIKDCPPDSFSIVIPNIFTPNGDGINETWQPQIREYGYSVENFSANVYDRWGVLIYEGNISSKQYGWDGHNTAGIVCSEGTYYYVVSYEAAGRAGEKKKGTVKGFLQLVR